MSAEDWELFIQEWAHYLRTRYHLVQRVGGGGDEGRDVVAFYDRPSEDERWDNYQCKHYDHPLYPSDILPEIGKLVFHIHGQAFCAPEHYYFVAPQGVGTSATKLLRTNGAIAAGLIEKWDQTIAPQISKVSPPKLTNDLRKFISTFDFSRVESLSPLTIIDGHRETPWHAHRFGGGLPERPAPPEVPTELQGHEARYVEQLNAAYLDHHGKAIPSKTFRKKYSKHFARSREDFYWAEQLRAFSRDTLPEGAFEALQTEIESGIIDIVESEHPDGFTRLRECVKAAKTLQVVSHSLRDRIYMKDRSGICHQLANEDRVVWVPGE